MWHSSFRHWLPSTLLVNWLNTCYRYLRGILIRHLFIACFFQIFGIYVEMRWRVPHIEHLLRFISIWWLVRSLGALSHLHQFRALPIVYALNWAIDILRDSRVVLIERVLVRVWWRKLFKSDSLATRDCLRNVDLLLLEPHHLPSNVVLFYQLLWNAVVLIPDVDVASLCSPRVSVGNARVCWVVSCHFEIIEVNGLMRLASEAHSIGGDDALSLVALWYWLLGGSSVIFYLTQGLFLRVNVLFCCLWEDCELWGG